MHLGYRFSIGCCAWMRRGELKLALAMRKRGASHQQCSIPLHHDLRLLLPESYTLQRRPLLPLQPHPSPTMTMTTQAQSHPISLPPLVGSSPSVSTCDASAQGQVGALRSSIQRGRKLGVRSARRGSIGSRSRTEMVTSRAIVKIRIRIQIRINRCVVVQGRTRYSASLSSPGIGADYLRKSGFKMFHLDVLQWDASCGVCFVSLRRCKS